MRSVTTFVIAIMLITCLTPAPLGARAAQSGPGASTQATISVQVDGATSFQTIEGFGVNANSRSWDLANPGTFTPQIDTLLTQANATIWRVVIESHENWETTNDNADPNSFNWTYYNSLYETDKFKKLWAMLAYLDSKGVPTIYLSVMGCLPTWMEVPNKRCFLPADGHNDGEWVEMIASMLYYARNTKHLRIDLFSPLNESDHPTTTALEGPKVSGDRYGALLKKLSDRLDAIGLSDIRLIGPDIAFSTNTQAYMNAIFADPALMTKYSHVSAHSYADLRGDLISTVAGSGYPNLTPWITEFSGACPGFKCDNGIPVTPDESWAFTTATFDYLLGHLNNDVTAALVWEGYDSYYEHHSANSYWGLISYDPATKVYAPTKRLYVARLAFRFIQPGMVRVDTTSSDSASVSVSAFHYPNSDKLTLIGRNMTSSPQTLSISLGGVGTPGALELYETTKSVDWQDSGSNAPSAGTYSVTLAADSMFALTNVPATPTADTQSPTVSFTSPANGATVGGTRVALSVAAGDNVGVVGIQYKLDGVNLGPERGRSSPSTTWNTLIVANGPHTLSATVRDSAGNTTTASRDVLVSNTVLKTYLPLVRR